MGSPLLPAFFLFVLCQMPSLGPSEGLATAIHVIQEFLLPDFDLSWKSPSSVYPYFGNVLTTRRAHYMSTNARRIYLESNCALQRGLLKNFFILVHPIPGVQESWIRIQIWRPVDLEKRRYQLVWEHRVLVDMEFFPEGVVHQFQVNSSHVPVATFDLIGWTFEEETNGPIGFDRLPSTKTLVRTLASRDFPRLGLVYEFEAEPLNAAFAVAVEIIDHDVCQGCQDRFHPLNEEAGEEDEIPGDYTGVGSKHSEVKKSQDKDTPESREQNISIIVGPVLAVVVLALGVANVALYVIMRQTRREHMELAQQRDSISSRRKEARASQDKPQSPLEDKPQSPPEDKPQSPPEDKPQSPPEDKPQSFPEDKIQPLHVENLQALPQEKPHSQNQEKPHSSHHDKLQLPPGDMPQSPPQEKPPSAPKDKPHSPPQEKSHSPPQDKPHSPHRDRPHSPPHDKPHTPPQEKPHARPQDKPRSSHPDKPRSSHPEKLHIPSQEKPRSPPQVKPRAPHQFEH